MKAVILAAGRGERLGLGLPKPLVRLLGRALIDHVMASLKEAGIEDIVVVYSDPRVKAHLEGRAKLVYNDDVERGSGYSLLRGSEAAQGSPFVLVMSDHIFDSAMVSRLIDSEPAATTLCVDRNLEGRNVEEATKVLVENNYEVTRIGKGLKEYNALDTGIFYCTREVVEAAKSFTGRFSVTDVMKKLVSKRRLKALDVTGYFWLDVDTQEELRRAEDELLRRLIKSTDGLISRHINRKFSLRISRILVNTPVTPNMLSVFSFLLGALSGALFALGYSIIAGIVAQLSSIIDGCDGEVARLKGMTSPFGTFLDATLDRYADMLIILGIIASDPERLWLVGGLAMLGSYSISYTTSKAELSGIVFTGTQYVLMNRDMRLFLIFLAGVVNQLFAVLLLLAVLCNLVALQRFLQFPKLLTARGAKA